MMPAASAEMTGLPDIGYSPASDGPFRCDHCQHYMGVSHSECWHPEVIKKAKAGLLKMDDDGHALIEAGGCCKFFRKGKTITQAKADRLLGASKVLGGKK